MSFKKPLIQPIRTRQAKLREESQKAMVHVNTEGLYEVSVEYSHCSDIATVCGFQAHDVSKSLEEDNRLCRTTQTPGNEDLFMDQEGPDVNFDSEELESEEDMEM